MTVIYTNTLTTDSDGNNGYTNVQRFEVAALTLPTGTITKLRFTVVAGAAQQLTITNMYVGHAAASGDAYDFSATPTQVTFSGSGSVTIPAGETVTSDWITFSYNKTSALLVAYYTAGGTGADTIRYKASVSNVNNYYKAAANEAATVDKTGYTTQSGYLVAINQVESDGGDSNFLYFLP